MVVSAGFKKV